jgi:hypothetical protein
MIQGFGLSGMASVLVLGFLLQTGTPPRTNDPHADPEEGIASVGCDGLVTYVETLFTTLDEHSTFTDFWVAPDYDGIQQMDRDEVQAIVDDGTALLADLDAMEVPESYEPGHEGLHLILDSDLDFVTFLGLDSSIVPALDQWEGGMARILQGELMTAKACPEELAAVGAYVFYDPASLETIFE